MEIQTSEGMVPLYRVVKELRQFGADLAGGTMTLGAIGSAAPAPDDTVMLINALGKDSAGNVQGYGSLFNYIIDPTSGAEQSAWGVTTANASFYVGDGGMTFTQPPSTATVFNVFDDTDAGYLFYSEVTTASPAANDSIMQFNQYSRNSANEATPYTQIQSILVDPTDGSEDAKLVFRTMAEGSAIDGLTLGAPLGSAVGHIFDVGTTTGRVQINTTAAGTSGCYYATYQNSATPAANDEIGGLIFFGEDSASNDEEYAYITGNIVDPTSTSEDGSVIIGTAVAGTANTRVTVQAGVRIGAPTGGDKGLGTLNATAVYDDDVLLTCYPYAAAASGTVDLDYWDAKVGREHEPARKFAARLGTAYDPTTLGGQRRHMADKRHLTPYPSPDKYTEKTRPSLGGWLQRGVEMDELLFLYVTQLEDRIAELEAKCSSPN